MKKVRLLLVDDEPVARAGIRAMLAQVEDIVIVGEAKDGNEACQMVGELHPHVLLLDLKMPGMKAWEVERWVRENHPSVNTLVLTAHHHVAYLAEMIAAGVSGYLKKSASPDELISSIRQAASGEANFSPELIEDLEEWRQESEKWKSLSRREREIVNWLARGAMNRFLAEEFAIAEKTVEIHITHILKKLGLESCKQVASWLFTYIPEELRGD